MTENKTLVVLTPGFPKEEDDSTCVPLQQSLVLTLKKNYPQLHIIVLSFQYPYRTDTYTWHGIPVIPFNGLNKRGFKKFWLRRKINSVLEAIHQKNRINGLLSFWCSECALVGKKFSSRHRVKHFCWILGRDALKKNNYPGKIKPGGDELVALSDFLQDEFERNHKIRPSHIVTSGIDSSLFPPSASKKEIDIMAAGSLIPLKQYDIFIEVIVGIKKQLPGIKTQLVGEGPERQKLEKLIASNGLGSNITLMGELMHQKLLEKMQEVRVFLHPSSYEGFSGVCLEALSAGAHVISFTRPMHADIPHWHIVSTKHEMIQKALELLKPSATEYFPVIPYRIEDSAKKFMQLFAM